jgi:ATP phosphoribosyltransferase regulatory subunit
LHTRPDGFAGSRSPLQVGAELFGHSGIESDVEVILLMLEMLETTGIQDLHIDLGHVGIFRGLARQAGLKEEQEEILFDALQRKARAEIDDFVTGLATDEKVRSMLAGLIDLNGGAEVLEKARKQLAGASPAVLDALTNLEQIANTISRKKPSIRLYYDLAELRGYQYQTGVVFAAYVPGHGQEIVRGGRYDDIGKVFGRARPATGFSADIKTLISLGPQQSYQQIGIFTSSCEDPAVQTKVAELRAAGERVVCALPGQYGGAQEMGCDRVLEKRDGNLIIVKIKDK